MGGGGVIFLGKRSNACHDCDSLLGPDSMAISGMCHKLDQQLLMLSGVAVADPTVSIYTYIYTTVCRTSVEAGHCQTAIIKFPKSGWTQEKKKWKFTYPPAVPMGSCRRRVWVPFFLLLLCNLFFLLLSSWILLMLMLIFCLFFALFSLTIQFTLD